MLVYRVEVMGKCNRNGYIKNYAAGPYSMELEVADIPCVQHDMSIEAFRRLYLADKSSYGTALSDFAVIGNDHSRHPMPSDDMYIKRKWNLLGENCEQHNWLFGFVSIEALNKWFCCLRAKIETDIIGECVVALYDIPDEHVCSGVKQCIFDGTAPSKRITHYSFTELHVQEEY